VFTDRRNQWEVFTDRRNQWEVFTDRRNQWEVFTDRRNQWAKSQEIVATWLLYSLQYPRPKFSKSSTWDLAFLARFICSLHGRITMCMKYT
jgi:hypothetical protein